MSTQRIYYSALLMQEGEDRPLYRSGIYECPTRGSLAEFIRDELGIACMPARLFRQVRVRELWKRLKTYGASCAHFRVEHGGNVLAFLGATEDEYLAKEELEEWL